jgi:hypothetical protein
MIRRIVAFTFTIGLALSGTQAFAQAVPPGTYQQSCSDVRVRGGQITANCSAPNGGRITSSTSVGCRGDIGNVNGYLRCNGGANANRPNGGNHGGNYDGNYGGGLPAGSYRQTCLHARMQGSVLVADCQTGTGGILRASLDMRSCRQGVPVGNQSGVLHCQRLH